MLLEDRLHVRLQRFDRPLARYVDLVVEETENVSLERRANQLAEQLIVV